METFTYASIEQNSHDPYTCSTTVQPFLACLDIASPSTLSNSVNATYSENEADVANFVTIGHTGINTSSTNLFGSDVTCGGKVIGDGTISALDLTIALFWRFKVPPYDSLSEDGSVVRTVEGETDPHLRCELGITREEHFLNYSVDDPCVIPGGHTYLLPSPPSSSSRRLSEESPTTLLVGVYEQARQPEGTWFHIRFETSFIVVELLLGGASSPTLVDIDNAAPPVHGNNETVPDEPYKYSVRFSRHAEYSEVQPQFLSRCASVTGGLSSPVAMYQNTLSVQQIPSLDRPLLCPFDIFLWVPGASGCDVTVLAGSKAMDGRQGATVDSTVQCVPNGFPGFVSPPSSPPSSPPEAEEKEEDYTLLIVIVTVLVTLACNTYVLYVCWRRRVRRTNPVSMDEIVTTTSDLEAETERKKELEILRLQRRILERVHR